MMLRIAILLVAVCGIPLAPAIHGQSQIIITLEETTYGYCDKLFYTVTVPRVTGDPAILHIIDDAGKRSSAIPIPINALENPVPSPNAFQPDIFSTGVYTIEIKYAGMVTTAEFELVDTGKKCIPNTVKQITATWISGSISDGFLMDSFQRLVEPDIIAIPFDIDEGNIYDIYIPEWVRAPSAWWLQDRISDDEYAGMINYLLESGIISPGAKVGT